jgi:glycosyltransferase involved in cell wall biosynthesis
LPRTEVVKGINITRLPVHLRISKGLLNLAYPYYAFAALLKTDLVLVNCPSLENIIVAIFAKILKKPVLALYHCDLDFRRGWLNRLAARVANFSCLLTCRLSWQIVTSSADYAKLSPTLRLLQKKVRFAYPPIEVAKPDRFYLKDLKAWYGKSSPIIGFVGRLSTEKNLETLIEAIEILKKQYPKIKLLCAGPFAFQVAGESKYYLKILRMLEEYGTDYEILGILDSQKLASFLSFIDLLVLPSNNRTEAFGMVQAEAMLLGTPVVAPNSSGIRVPVKETGMGALFDNTNPQSLALAIKKVYLARLKLTKKQKVAVSVFGQSTFLLPELKQLAHSA